MVLKNFYRAPKIIIFCLQNTLGSTGSGSTRTLTKCFFLCERNTYVSVIQILYLCLENIISKHEAQLQFTKKQTFVLLSYGVKDLVRKIKRISVHYLILWQNLKLFYII